MAPRSRPQAWFIAGISFAAFKMNTCPELSGVELPAEASAMIASAAVPVALVIGMSIHGLAIARALARHGVDVHSLGQNARDPSAMTRYAKAHFAQGINSERLGDVLLEIRPQLPLQRPIVLFPSSDNMVRAIANAWESLEPHYLLGWHKCRDRILELQSKDSIGPICKDKGIAYPESFVVTTEEDLTAPLTELAFPLLVKPVRSLALFKAIKVSNETELRELVSRYRSELPFLVQRWIEGDDSDLYFCTVYLHEGEVLCRFVGRKLRSRPRGTGMGTIVENYTDDELPELTERFLAGLNLSGPVAVEFKRDPQGKFWLIEPNVGRTEYSVDLLVQHGLNLPLIEYWAAQGIVVRPSDINRKPVMWFDTERETLAYARACIRECTLRPGGKTPVFPYFGNDDRGPFVRALSNRLLRPWNRLLLRVRQLRGHYPGLEIRKYAGIDSLPEEALERLREFDKGNLFFGLGWFRNFEEQVGKHEGRPEWYCVYNSTNQLIAVWPFVRTSSGKGTVLRAMGNYYSPYVSLPVQTNNDVDMAISRAALAQIVHSADHLIVSPVAPHDPFRPLIEDRLINFGILAFNEYFTTNWFQPIQDVAAYFGARSSELRNTLGRKARKLAREAEIEIRIITDRADLDGPIDDYFSVYDGSWKAREPYPDFVANLIRMAADGGWLRLGIMYVDGKPAAAQIWLVQHGTAFIYKLAYDEQFASRSVGTILTSHLIEFVVSHDKVSKLDYLTGNDAYKRSWMDYCRQLDTVNLVSLWRPRGSGSFIRHKLSLILGHIRSEPTFDSAKTNTHPSTEA